MKTKHLVHCILFLLLTTKVEAQLKLFSGGAISIGSTTTPNGAARLHIWGNGLFSSTSFAATSGSSAALIRGLDTYSDERGPDYTWWGDDRTGIFHPAPFFIGFTIGSEEKMRITDLGNLLIGGTYDGDFRVSIYAKEYKTALSTWTNHRDEWAYAHISYVNMESTKNWTVHYNEQDRFYVSGSGCIWHYGHVDMSDSTLKENVVELQNSKNKILQLRGVSYNFKQEVLVNPLDTITIISNRPPRLQIGMIAQEVERILPEIVQTNDKGLKGIEYSHLVALLIEAFKEQNSTIDSLRTQITECCALSRGSMKIRGENNSNSSTNDNSSARLDQNVPNPFNLNTKISFNIPEESRSKVLLVFDMQGTLLKQYEITRNGQSYLNISGGEFKAGMYLYSLVIDGKEIDTKRMILTN